MPEARPSRRSILSAAGVAVAASFTGALAHAAQDGAPAKATGELDLRSIPSTGEKIPSVGLGTSRQFDVELSDNTAVDELKQTLDAFLKAGGTVIDSSPMYGRAETTIGALSGDMSNNDKLWIATKVWTSQGENASEQMTESHKLLGREGKPLELMQVHNLVEIERNLPLIQQWKEEGKFRYIGITSSQRRVIPELTEYAEGKGGVKLDFIQLPYNVQMRDAAERLLPACKQHGVATMINVPFGSGRLLGNLLQRPLPDHAKEYAASWPQALLKFILANDAVTVIIPGTSNPKHVADNCGAMRGRLPTQDEIKKLIADVEG